LTQNKQYTKAITRLQRGIEISQVRQDKDWELKFLTDLGTSYYLNDDLDNALNYIEKAYETAVRLQQRQEEAFTAGRLASIQADRGELDASNELVKRSLKFVEEIEQPILQVEQLVLLAMNHQELGDRNEVIMHLEKALGLYQQVGHLDLVEEIESLRKELLE
jgi:tetratricopeptide (TPR) repeat protein